MPVIAPIVSNPKLTDMTGATYSDSQTGTMRPPPRSQISVGKVVTVAE